MNREVLRFLKGNVSQDPKVVDRLIVSAFLLENDLTVSDNRFLTRYVISESAPEEYASLQSFRSVLREKDVVFDFESLIKLFEYVISPPDRVVTGAVYTPAFIRKRIIDEFLSLGTEIDPLIKICDPACGCGSFLISAAKRIKALTGKQYKHIFQENIYGIDIQAYSVRRSKLLLALLALSEGEHISEPEFNIYEGNTLNFDWRKEVGDNVLFDLVLGNPPYVASRNIDEETKPYLDRWEVCSSGHPDLYIPFFQIGIEWLKEGGKLGYISMNTFFKSVNGRALRAYFAQHNLKLRIIDFGSIQVFRSRSTYTCLCYITKAPSDTIEYVKLNEVTDLEGQLSFSIISYQSLNSRRGWTLQNQELITKIEKTGYPFGSLYKTRNGIATLKNDIYMFEPVRADEQYYYLQNGSEYPIEKSICKEVVNPNKLNAENTIEGLKKKIIFPYEFDDYFRAQLLTENRFQKQFPKAYAYLSAKRDILKKRDKGKGKYSWFAYGRNQSLEKMEVKLLFPHITSSIPNCAISEDENLLFYNGLAVVGQSYRELSFLKKLIRSRLFWFYITSTSKPYGSGYFSLSRNYLKTFGVYQFNDDEKDKIIAENDQKVVDELIEKKYGVKLCEYFS